jgi:hypothetical protein
MLFGVLGLRYSNRAEYIGKEKVIGSIHDGGEFIQLIFGVILRVAS